MSEWIKDKLPPYGVPVLIRVGSTVQHITYMLDAEGDGLEGCVWYEPYHFDHTDDLKILATKITEWMELPE